ncbi:hypothetical protein [Nitrincola nitratireducens]|uniref:Uncharacterized protein n=1 Tax=Nitrincola nitratireducens TaxID=1229521 RepID=W9VLU7_9GAMM|nr:hypothetical protein [Nitrincola nitratireducens]EXJ11500.1 hypothetical protein D791_01632 [Nitrincola nitratireducens]
MMTFEKRLFSFLVRHSTRSSLTQRHPALATLFAVSAILMPIQGLAQGSPAGFRILATPQVLAHPEGGELLQAYVPANWHSVYREWLNNRGVDELVPQEQNLINWKQMLAFQVIDNPVLLPQHYLNDLKSTLSKECRFSYSQPLQTVTQPRYESAMIISWCGQVLDAAWGEIILTRVIRGESALYTLSKSWRTIPFSSVNEIGLPNAEIQHWQATLNRSNVCNMRDQTCAQ